MIICKIDASKIDEGRFYVDRNGRKWFQIVLFDSPNDKFGNDYVIKESLSKEERASGTQGKILGNAKTYGHGNGGKAPSRRDDNPPF